MLTVVTLIIKFFVKSSPQVIEQDFNPKACSLFPGRIERNEQIFVLSRRSIFYTPDNYGMRNPEITPELAS